MKKLYFDDFHLSRSYVVKRPQKEEKVVPSTRDVTAVTPVRIEERVKGIRGVRLLRSGNSDIFRTGPEPVANLISC